MPPRLRHACPLVALAIALAGAPASAQPSAADLETARTLFKEGKEKRAAGDLRGALETLKAAHALGQTPITALELARTHVLLGQLVEARELALGVARMPVQSDETARSAAARADAAKLAEELRPRIPTLVVRLVGDASGATVAIDGVALPAAARDQPRKVNPGEHTVSAVRAGDPEVTRKVAVGEAETREVALELLAPAPPRIAVAPRPAPAPVAPAPAPAPRRTSALVPIGLSATAVGVLVGAVTGISALSTASDLRATCPGYQCGPSEHDALARGRTMGNIATVSFGVAAVGLVVATVGFYTPREPKAASVTPYVGLGGAGIHGAF